MFHQLGWYSEEVRSLAICAGATVQREAEHLMLCNDGMIADLVQMEAQSCPSNSERAFSRPIASQIRMSRGEVDVLGIITGRNSQNVVGTGTKPH